MTPTVHGAKKSSADCRIVWIKGANMQRGVIAEATNRRAMPAALIAFAVLTATLAFELAWFMGVDPYGSHYFEAGSLVVLHNVFRPERSYYWCSDG